jgi:hypothetical protein
VLTLRPKMQAEVPVAEEFWLAIARNDRAVAQEVIDRLELPLVAISTFSFEEVRGELLDSQEREPLEQSGAQGALSPKLVSSDTPKATVDAWNLSDHVALLLVSKDEICVAGVTDGEVDFLACACALDRPRGTSCGWATHATGGKDAKGRLVLKMKLPEGGGVVFAIPVKASGSAVKRPKIFSLPTLALEDLPYSVLAEGWDETLRTLKLCAREWKFFIEIYQGASWLLGLLNNGGKEEVAGEQPSIQIPSPRMGRGGYNPEEFENESVRAGCRSPFFGDQVDSKCPPQRDAGVPLFPPRGDGGSGQSVSSVGSHEGSSADESAWLDAVEPLYEIPSLEGMPTEEAWKRVLIFTKAVFDDIRTVRALTLDKKNTPGMIWGSFRTTKLLEEYQHLKFYQHPQVPNMLALTLLQREGKKLEKALSTLGTLSKTVEAHQSKLGQLKKDVKAL